MASARRRGTFAVFAILVLATLAGPPYQAEVGLDAPLEPHPLKLGGGAALQTLGGAAAEAERREDAARVKAREGVEVKTITTAEFARADTALDVAAYFVGLGLSDAQAKRAERLLSGEESGDDEIGENIAKCLILGGSDWGGDRIDTQCLFGDAPGGRRRRRGRQRI